MDQKTIFGKKKIEIAIGTEAKQGPRKLKHEDGIFLLRKETEELGKQPGKVLS